MATQFYLQNNFTHGELDPRLYAGTNLEYYYKSLKKCRNLYVRPQGGIKRRHGTIYEETLNSTSGEYTLGGFVYDSDTKFVFVFENLNIASYQIQSDGDLTFDSNITTPYTTSDIENLQFAQNGNFMVIVHPDYPPKELTWDASTSAWNTLIDLPIKNYPTYDFNKDYYSLTFTLAGGTTIGHGKNLTTSTSANIFTADHVGGLFISLGASATEPIGIAQITAVTGPYPASSATTNVIYPFDSSITSGVSGNNSFLGETAFNSTKGYPRAVTFYEDRLVLGGTPSLPQTMFMSKIGAFNDFYQGDSSDDDAIIFTLSSSDYNEIRYLISDKSLQVFCTEAEFSSMQYFAEPLTPETASFRKQSGYGSENVQPVILDNQTFFIREGGSSIMSFIFDQGNNSYNSINASIFAANLVKQPVDSAVLKGDGEEDSDYVFFINNDGTLLVYQTLAQQNVSAFSICQTGNDHQDLDLLSPTKGKYKKIVNVKGNVYVAVERIVDGITVQYLERLTFDVKTDCSTEVLFPNPVSTISGLNYLENEFVRVVGDGKILNNEEGTQVINGTITLNTTAKFFQIGLNYNVLAETIPINIAGSGRLYLPGKIVRGFIDYFESLGIIVNGLIIPDIKFGNDTLDKVIPPQTGVFEIRGNQWGIRESIKITQNDPLPFLVIGLGFEVTK